MADTQLEIIQTLSVPLYAPRHDATPIPTAAWNDEPLYCLEVNDQWVSHILGVLVALDQPDTWIGTSEEIDAARQQVNEIMAAFMAACGDNMNCCVPPLTRIAADGSLEVSTDGGSTWTPAAGTDDPRNLAPQLAPLTGEDGDDKRCKAANNCVRQMKDLQAQWSDSLDSGLTLIALGLAFAGAIAGLFLTAGTAAVFLVPAILNLVAAVAGTGSAAYDDLFTPDVWDFALCQFYLHCEPDGSFTQTEFNNIMANFDTEFTGNLALAFSGAMQGWQLVGLNRVARIASSDNLDCSACDATCDADIWEIVTYSGSPVGSITSRGSNWIIVQGGSHGDFGTPWNAMIQTPANDICCIPVSVEWLTGDHDDENLFGVDCGAARWPGSPNGAFDMGVAELNTVYFRKDAGSNFTAKITFG